MPFSLPRVITWETDSRGHSIYFDEFWYLYTGQSREQASNHGWLNAMHPADRILSTQLLNKMARYCNGFRVRRRIRSTDGIYRWNVIAGAPRFDSVGDCIGFIGSILDIEDFMCEPEATNVVAPALIDKSKKISFLFNNVIDPCAQVDMSGRFLSMNDAYIEMLGYSGNEFRELKNSDITPTRWHAFESDVIKRQVIPRGYSDIYEKEYVHKDGRVVPVELRTILQCDIDGTPVGMCITVRENSARKSVDAELLAMNARNEEFLATLAHELRNRISPIRNGINSLIALEKEEIKDRGILTLAAMNRQSDDLERILDRIIDASRIRVGKLEMIKEVIDIREVIHNVVQDLKLLSNSKKQSLLLTLPPDNVMVFADRLRLSQVFVNIINNAMKFTGDDGSIWLDFDVRSKDVVITVRDSGIGIVNESIKSIFGMFWQDPGADSADKGLGVGLAFADEVVSMHGGKIEARSSGRAKGAEFAVTIPVISDGGNRDFREHCH